MSAHDLKFAIGFILFHLWPILTIELFQSGGVWGGGALQLQVGDYLPAQLQLHLPGFGEKFPCKKMLLASKNCPQNSPSRKKSKKKPKARCNAQPSPPDETAGQKESELHVAKTPLQTGDLQSA